MGDSERTEKGAWLPMGGETRVDVGIASWRCFTASNRCRCLHWSVVSILWAPRRFRHTVYQFYLMYLAILYFLMSAFHHDIHSVFKVCRKDGFISVYSSG